MRGEIKAHFLALLRLKLDRSRDAQKPTILGRNTRSKLFVVAPAALIFKNFYNRKFSQPATD